jgi:hypothetical protein
MPALMAVRNSMPDNDWPSMFIEESSFSFNEWCKFLEHQSRMLQERSRRLREHSLSLQEKCASLINSKTSGRSCEL